MAQDFLPTLTAAAPFARAVVVGGGGLEGRVFTNDIPGLGIPLRSLRGHLTSVLTLSLESLAKEAPEVSFIHEFPGSVLTALFDRGGPWLTKILKFYLWLGQRWLCVPIEECGERHVFLSTTPRYAPLEGGESKVEEVDMFRGSDGQVGSGTYSVGWDNESSPASVEAILAAYRKDGTADLIWKDANDQFARIAAA
jgi:hypothetical protein